MYLIPPVVLCQYELGRVSTATSVVIRGFGDSPNGMAKSITHLPFFAAHVPSSSAFDACTASLGGK